MILFFIVASGVMGYLLKCIVADQQLEDARANWQRFTANQIACNNLFHSDQFDAFRREFDELRHYRDDAKRIARENEAIARENERRTQEINKRADFYDRIAQALQDEQAKLKRRAASIYELVNVN